MPFASWVSDADSASVSASVSDADPVSLSGPSDGHPRMVVDTKNVMTYFLGIMAEDEESEAYLNLVRAHERLNRDLGKFFEERGTTHQQYRVLEVLHRSQDREEDDEGLSCQEIGERMVNHVPDVTRLLDRLEKAGLVSRTRCKRDRRVVRSRLTREGRALVERIEAPLKEARKSLLGALNRNELRTLKELLKKASSDD